MAKAGELLEDFVDISADVFMAREKTEVGVGPGGFGVIVSGAQVHVAAHTGLFPTND